MIDKQTLKIENLFRIYAVNCIGNLIFGIQILSGRFSTSGQEFSTYIVSNIHFSFVRKCKGRIWCWCISSTPLPPPTADKASSENRHCSSWTHSGGDLLRSGKSSSSCDTDGVNILWVTLMPPSLAVSASSGTVLAASLLLMMCWWKTKTSARKTVKMLRLCRR